MKKGAALLLLVLLQVVISARSSAQAARLITKEEPLGKFLPGADLQRIATDPSFRRVAYVVQRDGKELAVIDGVEGKEYDHVAENNEMFFSPDGQRLAYVAKRGDKMLVVVDGQEGREYDFIYDLFNPIFSSDSRQVAYIAGKNSKLKAMFGGWSLSEFVVVDGQEGKSFQLVEGLVFSPDSSKLAYQAQRKWNQGTSVVVDGVEGKQYQQIVFTHFSPDSSRLAYVAYILTDPQKPGMNLAVIDGKEGPQYQSVGSVVFSPDSKHTAYNAGYNGGSIVRDDVPGPRFNAIPCDPVFSPDGKRLAYVAQAGDNYAYVVVVDDKVVYDCPDCEGILDLVFSPDSQHLVYTVYINKHWFAALDGTVLPQTKDLLSPPCFTPDGKRLIYLKQRGEKVVPVFGELEGKEYDRFLESWPFLSIGGMDGFRRETFVFDDRQTIHAMALRGDEIIRLEFKIEE